MKTEQELLDYFESYRHIKLGIGELKDFEAQLKEYFKDIRNININNDIEFIGHAQLPLPYHFFYTLVFNVPKIFECGYISSRDSYVFRHNQYNYVTVTVDDYIDLMLHCVLLKGMLINKQNRYYGNQH